MSARTHRPCDTDPMTIEDPGGKQEPPTAATKVTGKGDD
ncbi:hypothetical protein BC938DRAFT_476018, partial [Jimgerdemannia flammicorona]